MKKFFVFALTLMAGVINLFAQDCVETDVNLTGTSSITFTRNPHKILTGVFTVGTDKHVIFSQGNLQYQASSDTWRFAEEQWISKSSGNTTEAASRATQSEWIDLFGWACSGWRKAGDTYPAYQPWAIDEGKEDYLTGKINLVGSTYKDADWAYHNTIINGGVSADGPLSYTWITLTSTEWANLIDREDGESRLLYGFGTLMGVQGLYLLPDGWDWSDIPSNVATKHSGESSFHGVSLSTLISRIGTYGSEWVFGTSSDNTTNVIGTSSTVIGEGSEDYAFWLILEEQGVVFLPVTSVLTGGSYQSGTDNYGFYWSTSYSGNQQGNALRFKAGSINPAINNRWHYLGHAVRPVYHLDY